MICAARERISVVVSACVLSVRAVSLAGRCSFSPVWQHACHICAAATPYARR